MQSTFNPEPLWIARRRLGLTQKQVAERLGKHRFTIIRIESGSSEVSKTIVREYADLLGVEASDVLTETEETA